MFCARGENQRQWRGKSASRCSAARTLATPPSRAADPVFLFWVARAPLDTNQRTIRRPPCLLYPFLFFSPPCKRFPKPPERAKPFPRKKDGTTASLPATVAGQPLCSTPSRPHLLTQTNNLAPPATQHQTSLRFARTHTERARTNSLSLSCRLSGRFRCPHSLARTRTPRPRHAGRARILLA